MLLEAKTPGFLLVVVRLVAPHLGVKAARLTGLVERHGKPDDVVYIDPRSSPLLV